MRNVNKTIDEVEEINASDMIFSSLVEKLGNPESKYIEQVRTESKFSEPPEIKYGTEKTTEKTTERETRKVEPRKIDLPDNVSAEKLLELLYMNNDILISAFSRIGMDSDATGDIAKAIAINTKTIQYLGGPVEEFNPIEHISGLSSPVSYENAKKIIGTTKQCYKAGQVENSGITDNGLTIQIIFSGDKGGVRFRAIGSITASEWGGNEAIDYVYTRDGGRMSIKVFENNRWTDKTSTGKYQINWELEELDKENSTKDIENNLEKNINEIKEDTQETKKELENENNEDEENEEIGDFPITDREKYEKDNNYN